MEIIKKCLTYILVAFALISLGFSLGKYSLKDKVPQKNASVKSGNYVAVYYMHSTFRCVTCNAIEKMTKKLLDKFYSKEKATGSIEWQEIDFQENETLAKQFEVAASCIVVALIANGKMVDFKRLDDVWTRMNDPEAFNEYIKSAIDPYLDAKRDV